MGEIIIWDLGNLQPGSGVVVSMPATVLSGSSAPPDGTDITFNASLFESNLLKKNDSQSVTVQSLPALTLSVNASDNTVASDDILIYHLTYGNRQQASALNSVLKFPIPNGTRFVSVTGGGTLNAAQDEVIWQLGTLPGHHGAKQEVKLEVLSLPEGALSITGAVTLDAQINQKNEQARAKSITRVESCSTCTGIDCKS